MTKVVTNLRLAIVASGRTQRDIAAALDLHEVTFSQYVNGKRIPSDDRKEAIAAELGRRPAELFGDREMQAAA